MRGGAENRGGSTGLVRPFRRWIRVQLLAPVLQKELLFLREECAGMAEQGAEGAAHLEGHQNEDTHPEAEVEAVFHTERPGRCGEELEAEK